MGWQKGEERGMQIIIEGADALPDGVYGSWSYVEEGVLHIVVDPERSPEDSAYPVTKGLFS